MSTVIITGASRGIGKATALLLSRDFDNMAIISRTNSEKLLEVCKEVNSAGCNCHSYVGDVSNFEFIKSTFLDIVNKTGSIDVLINNAGISMVGLFIDMEPTEWNNIMSTNLNSIYNTCHEVLPYMINRKCGKIINISSVWGLCGASCEVAYSATKGAINSFTKALAKELAPSNISVNAIAFGAVDTEMNSHLEPDEKSALEEEIPCGKMATPEEAALCIKNIIDMPAYLTGEIIKFDGGWI